MITISLCMIVKNEEAVLKRCLESAREAADEMIVVDTGSQDRTKEIAREAGARVFEFPWTDDFAAARNFSFSKAAMDFCMWLDADDVLLPEDREQLKALKQSLAPDVDMVMMKYHTAFDQRGKPVFSYYRERLVRNGKSFRWIGAVHEVIPPRGKVIYSPIAVTHQKIGPGDPDRNLRIFEKLLREGTPLDPRQRFYYARELYYHENYTNATESWAENRRGCGRFSEVWSTTFQGRRFAAISGHTLWKRENFSRRFTGTRLLLPVRETTAPAALCCLIATTIFRTCSCAFAMTGWGIIKPPGLIMKKPESASRIPRLIWPIRFILTTFWVLNQGLYTICLKRKEKDCLLLGGKLIDFTI